MAASLMNPHGHVVVEFDCLTFLLHRRMINFMLLMAQSDMPAPAVCNALSLHGWDGLQCNSAVQWDISITNPHELAVIQRWHQKLRLIRRQ